MNGRSVFVVFAWVIVALCLFSWSQPTLQAADGWFGDSATSAGASAGSKKSTKSWYSWPYGKSKKKSSSRSKPSMLQSLTRGTKNTWDKTTSFLNPFDDKPAAAAPASKSQPNTGGWFSSRDPENKPTSVPEWLGGEMPTF